MAARGAPVTLDERALNIFTDGSMYPGPRRGGLAFLVVVVGDDGHEQVYEEPRQGFQGATSQQMELMACIEALEYIVSRYSPVDPSGYSRVVIYTDSMYVKGNFSQALNVWATTGSAW